MKFDEYGIDEVKGQEVPFRHINYPNIKFNKSSFLKEWVDKYINNEITIILDIGALEGGDSLRFSSWYPNATIFTIEGSPHNYEVINKNLGNVLNIKTYNCLMSDTNGLVNFNQTTYNCNDESKYMVIGSIYDIKKEKKEKHKLGTIKSINVESVTFDKFCENNDIKNVDIAHIDVEGAGYNVILGMNKILPKLIFIEKESSEFYNDKTTGGNEELIKLLNKKGYTMVVELNNDYLFKLKI